MRVHLMLSGLALALCVAVAPAPVLAKSHKADKPSKEDREAMTKARLEAATAAFGCTIESLMDQVEADNAGLLATEGNFKCKFKDDTCRFSVEAVDPVTGVGSEFKFGEDCVLIPEEFFEPGICTRALALDFARASVVDVAPEDLTLCKIDQEIEEDEVAMTMHNIWEIQLSISDDPATPDVNEFQTFKVEVEDTVDGCALFEEEEEEED